MNDEQLIKKYKEKGLTQLEIEYRLQQRKIKKAINESLKI